MTQRAGIVEPPLLDPVIAGTAPSSGGGRLQRGRRATSLTPASALGLGVALIWFSLLVLIPLTAVLVQASEGGWSTYWDTLRAIRDERGTPPPPPRRAATYCLLVLAPVRLMFTSGFDTPLAWHGW